MMSANGDSINVNGFEELTEAAGHLRRKTDPIKMVDKKVAIESEMESDSDDEIDDSSSTVTSWSDEDSVHEEWSEKAWSEDDQVRSKAVHNDDHLSNLIEV